MTRRRPHPFWTVEGCRAAAGGRLIGAAPDPGATIEGVSIDSRTIKPGEAFLAIRGDRFDGAEYADAAIEAGARLIIGEESIGERAVPVIAVEDPISALARLAATWRDCLSGTRIVAVTGTNGKTTTANLIHAACRHSLIGSVSERSFNNHLGAPLTVLRAHETDDYLVCEIGTSGPGEIARLAGIVRPDIGVVTSIGLGHAQGLGGLEGVRVEKGALIRGLPPDGVAIIPAGEQGLLTHAEAQNIITFGSEIDADLVAGPARYEPLRREDGSEIPGIAFTLNGDKEVRLPLLGDHNARNAAAAIAAAEQLGVRQSAAIEGLASAVIPGMRLELRTIAGVRVLNDAYNANPDSMRAAIETAASIPRQGRLVLVLGDMLELGELSGPSHRGIGRLIARLESPVTIITIGPAAAAIADEARGAPMVESVTALPTTDDAAIARAVSMLVPGDTALLKASRGIGLERVADRLIAQELDPTATPNPSGA
ncbi:MAG: UDP-N-acetylmuramoyl-tripeptide--D-alanyl-D-alanine ligase [Phycisphaeraceae bacterium]|nr:UDP-N-acetylmuramoyl-tripeptide--D-alanyl-D-alanine ligase [Phycisphaeraceae bacterium]